MGLSIPDTNLKNFEYININTDSVMHWSLNPSQTLLRYLVLRYVDLSEIDEIFFHGDINNGLVANKCDITMDLDKSTVLDTQTATGVGALYWNEWIDVSSYTGRHILGVLIDFSNDNGVGAETFDIYELFAWGKLAD